MARANLPTNRKFLRLADFFERRYKCGGRVVAAGALTLLWHSAYEAASEKAGDAGDVERAAEWRGPKGELVAALLQAGGEGRPGFIVPDPDEPGCYLIHDFWDHAPDYVARRAKREAARTCKGITITEVRSRAGKLGAAAKRLQANDQQTSANECHLLPACQQTPASPDCEVANDATPVPVPVPDRKGSSAPDGAADTVEPARKPKTAKPTPSLPFRAEEALHIIAVSAKGRFLDSNPGGQAVEIERVIKAYPDRNVWAQVGAWLFAGGEGFAGQLDSRWVTRRNFAAAVERIKAKAPTAPPPRRPAGFVPDAERPECREWQPPVEETP